jgi:ribonuclease BN (tRNA processing enzyme)
MPDVSVQFLGSGDAFGSGGRLQTCIYVEAGDTRCLLDCGTSSLIAMRRWGVEPALIDVILVVPGRNNPSLYTVNGRPLYVHLNGLAIV